MTRLCFSLCLVLLAASASLARMPEQGPPRWGIVLAAFGSTRPGGMAAVEKARARFEAAFPGVPVRVGLTSRHAVKTLRAPGVLAAMAGLADEGYARLYVQPLLVSAGLEYQDWRALARALNALARPGVNKPPFDTVLLADAALGANRAGDPKALAETADALAEDVALAREKGAALVYAAHGNPRWPARELAAFRAVMARQYPGVPVLAGTLESRPGVADVLRGLKTSGKRTVILFPLLFGAGMHASDDLCGQAPGSWRSLLEQAGYQVDCRMRGLGDVDAVLDMLVARARKHLNPAKGTP